MPKYSRLKLKLTDIPLDSAIQVFTFLNQLLNEKRLDLDFFKSQYQRFTIGEMYFLMYYSIRYFDYNNPKSHLRLYIKEVDDSKLMIDEFVSYKFQLKFNAEKLRDYCLIHIDSIRSRYCKSLIKGIKVSREWIIFDNSNLETVETLMLGSRDKRRNKGFTSVSMNSIRLPISVYTSANSTEGLLKHNEMNGVLDEFKVLFSDFLSNSDIQSLSKNLFRKSRGDNSMIPLKFLSLDCISKSDLYDRIYKLYIIYRKGTKEEMLTKYKIDRDKYITSLNSYRNNLTSKNDLSKEEIQVKLNLKEKELSRKLELKNKFKYNSTNVTRYDFLCAFFFSFPIIRNSYLNKAKCSKFSDLPNYLRIECRNIKLRK